MLLSLRLYEKISCLEEWKWKKNFKARDFAYFLQKLFTSRTITSETSWSRAMIISQSELFWFWSSQWNPILSNQDCNVENWGLALTYLYLDNIQNLKIFEKVMVAKLHRPSVLIYIINHGCRSLSFFTQEKTIFIIKISV